MSGYAPQETFLCFGLRGHPLNKMKKSTTIILIRHGETGKKPRFQKPEDGLSKKGVKEVKTLAKELESYSIDAYFSSPYRRALDTAQILAGSKKITVDSHLREIPLWYGPEDLEGDDKRLELTKILIEAQDGVSHVLENITENYAGKVVALACHGNITRAILALTLKMGLDTVVRLQTFTAAYSILDRNPAGYYSLRLFNSKPF